MMKGKQQMLTVILALLVSGCQNDDKEVVYVPSSPYAPDAPSAPSTPQPPAQEDEVQPPQCEWCDSNQLPIEVDDPVSTVIGEDVNLTIDGTFIGGKTHSIQGGYLYEMVTEYKPFQDYYFNVSLSYRYRVNMTISVNGGQCVTVSFWRGDVLFSDPNIDCDYNTIYNQEDFTSMYGYLMIDDGRNFVAELRRDGEFYGEWWVM